MPMIRMTNLTLMAKTKLQSIATDYDELINAADVAFVLNDSEIMCVA